MSGPPKKPDLQSGLPQKAVSTHEPPSGGIVPSPPAKGESVRETIVRSIAEVEGSAENAKPVDHGTKFNTADIVVFAVCELTAIPLCHAGWEAVVSDHHLPRGIAAIVIGLPIGLLGASFHWWKDKIARPRREWIQKQALQWWPAAFLLFFLYVTGPEIYRRATDHTPPARSASSSAQPIPTSLRLQFNAAGEAPQEIDAQNVKWTFVRINEFIALQQASCPPNPLTLTNPASCLLPSPATATTAQNLLIFLSFSQPITAKKIKLDSHKAKIPEWDKTAQTETFAVLRFHGEPTNMILDIQPTD
jgi:hypothetical protein